MAPRGGEREGREPGEARVGALESEDRWYGGGAERQRGEARACERRRCALDLGVREGAAQEGRRRADHVGLNGCRERFWRSERSDMVETRSSGC